MKINLAATHPPPFSLCAEISSRVRGFKPDSPLQRAADVAVDV